MRELVTPKKYQKKGISFKAEYTPFDSKNGSFVPNAKIFFRDKYEIGYVNGTQIWVKMVDRSKDELTYVTRKLKTMQLGNFNQAMQYVLDNAFDIFHENDLFAKEQFRLDGGFAPCDDEIIYL